jgi:hypothetical protein
MDLIDFPAFCSARRNSYTLCRFNQNSAVVPKKCARRSAVSPLIARWPFRMPVTQIELECKRGSAHPELLEFFGQMLAGMDCGWCHVNEFA